MSSEPLVIDPLDSSFYKELAVPSSKSYANRLLILAAIKKEDVTISNIPLSSDVVTMISCLRKIGLIIDVGQNSLVVRGSFPECEGSNNVRLATGDGGTTNRFLIPLLARGKQKYEIIPEGHMKERPMGPLINSLTDLGCAIKYNEGETWISIQGPYIEKKETRVDCSTSTQFLTGLSLATVDLDIEINPIHLEVSLPYWELTLDLLKQFNEGSIRFENPVDFSSLTYPLALAAVRGEVLITNTHQIDEYQADSNFIEVLKEMGANIKFTPEGLHCKRNQLKAIEFDGSQCPDAIPTLLYVCSFAEGRSRLYNLEVLTHKECDRFHEMIRMMRIFGIKVEVDEERYEIIVYGKSGSIKKVDIIPARDHRMVMVAYLFMKSLGGGTLHHHEHVAKSFANFFELMD